MFVVVICCYDNYGWTKCMQKVPRYCKILDGGLRADAWGGREEVVSSAQQEELQSYLSEKGFLLVSQGQQDACHLGQGHKLLLLGGMKGSLPMGESREGALGVPRAGCPLLCSRQGHVSQQQRSQPFTEGIPVSFRGHTEMLGSTSTGASGQGSCMVPVGLVQGET